MTTDAQDHEPWDPEREGAEAEEAAAEARPDRGRRMWWVIGGPLLVVALVLTVWFGVSSTEDAITTTDIGFEHPNDREILMVFDVTRPTGTALSCTVTAMDGEYARVGTAEHEVPASTERTSRVRASVRTTTKAVTATVQDCTAVD